MPSGNEFFEPNDNYGIAHVLREYAGVPHDVPLAALVPHGVYLDDTTVAEGERRAQVPAVLSYPDYRDRLWARSTDKWVIPCASPFVYADELTAAGSASERPRCGTLFMPAHSTRYATANMDWHGLALLAAGLAERFHPVEVCMYFRDIELGRHRFFEEAGLEVVCAGHIYDHDFLPRLIRMMRSHRYVVGNSMGSHIFYGTHLGCRCQLIPYDVCLTADRPAVLDAEKRSYSLPWRREISYIKGLFSKDPDEHVADKAIIAARLLRTDAVLSPRELSTVIERTLQLDKRGSVFVRGWCPPVTQVVPYRIRRRTVLALAGARRAGVLARRKILGVATSLLQKYIRR